MQLPLLGSLSLASRRPLISGVLAVRANRLRLSIEKHLSRWYQNILDSFLLLMILDDNLLLAYIVFVDLNRILVTMLLLLIDFALQVLHAIAIVHGLPESCRLHGIFIVLWAWPWDCEWLRHSDIEDAACEGRHVL